MNDISGDSENKRFVWRCGPDWVVASSALDACCIVLDLYGYPMDEFADVLCYDSDEPSISMLDDDDPIEVIYYCHEDVPAICGADCVWLGDHGVLPATARQWADHMEPGVLASSEY